MPHQCLGCDEVYGSDSDVILQGCPKCGHKLFLFIKKMPTEKEAVEITKEKKEMIMKEVEDIVEIQDPDAPIILKLENIRVLSPGKYELDINQLMRKEKPVIYRIQDGTYVIDLNFISENGISSA